MISRETPVIHNDSLGTTMVPSPSILVIGPISSVPWKQRRVCIKNVLLFQKYLVEPNNVDMNNIYICYVTFAFLIYI